MGTFMLILLCYVVGAIGTARATGVMLRREYESRTRNYRTHYSFPEEDDVLLIVVTGVFWPILIWVVIIVALTSNGNVRQFVSDLFTGKRKLENESEDEE